MTPDAAPLSAARLAEQLGDRLPDASSLPQESFTLVERVRELMDAVVMTDADATEQAAAAARVAEITEALQSKVRPQPWLLVRHADGRLESLTQAGSGRLNPQAPDLDWVRRPTEPPPGSSPRPVEVEARCIFTVRHGGSPGRVHGSVLAGVLDEATGIAIRAAGSGGMTVALNVSLRGGVPLGSPVSITARYTGGEGRKAYATGEVTVEGVVVATAEAIYVAERT